MKIVNFFSKHIKLGNKNILSTVEGVIKNNLTYIEKDAILDLVKVAINNEKNHIDGIMIETGCALGGSAIALASAKNKDRQFYIYDVFGMIPPPSEKDDEDIHERYKEIASGNSVGLGNQLYYGYEENLYDKIVQQFKNFGFEISENNIHFVKGLYEDTLTINSPVALAHIDCDWFDSVWVCLERIEPYLVNGGTIVIDDYQHWSGCRKAVDEYFHKKKDNYQFIQKSRLHIIKR
ncbi:TylF/MycF/NovP-related O-methyltransferase [Mastigocladopsis repens]|uniref:TylF/MycF/NovP-related O-methyltransferase n=1 Tax=Mastigocladopsis repens TaxID=221287 RepID=UPI0002E588E7|nr:TylF/MycF/NovP-related O-methyltransferase [Mastigocladopsis repens]